MPDSKFSSQDVGERPSWSDPDYQFLLSRHVTILAQKGSFYNALNTLSSRGYYLLQLTYTGQDAFISDLLSALKWDNPAAPWSGNAFDFDELLLAEPFNSADRTAICVEGFNRLLAENPTLGNNLLDAIERAAREYMLFGKMLMGLVCNEEAPPGQVREVYGRWME